MDDNLNISEYPFVVIFTAAFTPIPYKVFSISAGAFDINFFTFVVASILGRGLRFYGITIVLWYFGRPVKRIIDKYFNLLAILLLLISIISYIIIVYIF
jgi:membrane protein DedA with SNARE-associated domain